MDSPDEFQKRIKSFSDTVNAFKSEAVQIHVIEVLLNKLGVGTISLANTSVGTSRQGKKKRTPRKAVPAKDVKSGNQSQRAGKASGSPGASAMISALLDSGFFKSGKTIGNIVSHCETSKGHHYKASECSPALLHLLRGGKLERKKNDDGQYEYIQS